MASLFLIKPFCVEVRGFAQFTYFAASRGKALSKAWGDYRVTYNDVSFGDFLKIAHASFIASPPERFGEPITVGGQPAFYVSHSAQYVQFVRPGETEIFNAHPLDVVPRETNGAAATEPLRPRHSASADLEPVHPASIAGEAR